MQPKSIVSFFQDHADTTYREFNARLNPTVDKDDIIGVRSPVLRSLAKQLKESPDAELFMQQLPHRYLEENQLHAMLIAQSRDYAATIERLTLFLPHVDSWAVTDIMFNCRCFPSHRDEINAVAFDWLTSPHPYTCRYAIGVLMHHAMPYGGQPMEQSLRQVAAIHSDDYYVNMMVAWFFATALAKQWEATLPYIEQHRLPEWTHRKAIRKAIESYRVSDEHKAHLRRLLD